MHAVKLLPFLYQVQNMEERLPEGLSGDRQGKRCRILSLDGGGAKGFYTLGALKEIEGLTDVLASGELPDVHCQPLLGLNWF